ncbi:MAG TPA: ATP-binding protein, partial [Hanamia sp.]
FAIKWKIHNSVYSQLKNGKMDGLLKDGQWLLIGRELNVDVFNRKWNVARTMVYADMEDNIRFCQEYRKSMMLVDDTSIGKTFCAKHIVRQVKNGFYLDCSQAKTKQLFIRTLAKVIGLDNTGRYYEVKANLKYYLKQLETPIIVLDEVGDLEYSAFLELKELWNGTEGMCGYYLMGADGLEEKINRGINHKKVGYREIFSRFNNQFMHIVPRASSDRLNFYRKLITDVLTVNCSDKAAIPALVKQCMANFETGNIGGLRRAEIILQLRK